MVTYKNKIRKKAQVKKLTRKIGSNVKSENRKLCVSFRPGTAIKTIISLGTVNPIMLNKVQVFFTFPRLFMKLDHRQLK